MHINDRGTLSTSKHWPRLSLLWPHLPSVITSTGEVSLICTGSHWGYKSSRLVSFWSVSKRVLRMWAREHLSYHHHYRSGRIGLHESRSVFSSSLSPTCSTYSPTQRMPRFSGISSTHRSVGHPNRWETTMPCHPLLVPYSVYWEWNSWFIWVLAMPLFVRSVTCSLPCHHSGSLSLGTAGSCMQVCWSVLMQIIRTRWPCRWFPNGWRRANETPHLLWSHWQTQSSQHSAMPSSTGSMLRQLAIIGIWPCCSLLDSVVSRYSSVCKWMNNRSSEVVHSVLCLRCLVCVRWRMSDDTYSIASRSKQDSASSDEAVSDPLLDATSSDVSIHSSPSNDVDPLLRNEILIRWWLLFSPLFFLLQNISLGYINTIAMFIQCFSKNERSDLSPWELRPKDRW